MEVTDNKMFENHRFEVLLNSSAIQYRTLGVECRPVKHDFRQMHTIDKLQNQPANGSNGCYMERQHRRFVSLPMEEPKTSGYSSIYTEIFQRNMIVQFHTLRIKHLFLIGLG